ncbi:MAG: DUF4340 domain-containing protein [Lachnospiraceae bacterium]|nr:DUF4340 domain-containing protein [Lachnospiraceae bacterium]
MGKKKIKTLLVLVAVMLLCIAGYVAVSHINFEKEEEDKSIALYDGMSAEDVTAFSYNVEEEVYGYSLVSGEWHYDANPDVKLDQDTIKSMLSILAGFKSERVLEASKDGYAEYGLEKPYKTIAFETKDGVKHKLTVGDKNINSKYYARIDDENKIYTIDATVSTYFGKTADELSIEESSESTQ